MQVNKRNLQYWENDYLQFVFFLLRKLLFNYRTFFPRTNTEKTSKNKKNIYSHAYSHMMVAIGENALFPFSPYANLPVLMFLLKNNAVMLSYRTK